MKPHQHRHRLDDDEDVPQDGQTLRVPFHALDSLGRAVSRTFDGSGNRPGYRVADDLGLSRKRAKQAIYAAYDRQISEAYKNVADETGELPRGSQAGDSCTIKGRGHLEMIGDVPDKAADATTITDARAAAYTEYEEFLRNAWRGHL